MATIVSHFLDEVSGLHTVSTREGAVLLSVGLNDSGTPMVYAMEDLTKPYKPKKLQAVVGSGTRMPDTVGPYLGHVKLKSGAQMHVFEDA